LVDSCLDEAGSMIKDAGKCDAMYPYYGDPRIAAGAPFTDDVLKCALKGLDVKEYKQSLDAGQVARLRAVFPQGICDFSKPGVGQTGLQGTWLVY
jgi:hypothetical protein